MLLPQDAHAKGKKSVAASESSKKTSKKANKASSAKTSTASKKAKSTTAAKAGKKTRTAHQEKASSKASRHASKKTTTHIAKRSTRHTPARTASDPAYVWQNTGAGKQAYYIMPGATGAIQEPAEQPVADVQPPAFEEQQVATAATENLNVKPYQVGTASYYSSSFEGKRTASGERFSQDNLTCAHGSLPFGCRLRVTNLRNNQAVDVRVNDRGGFHRYGRVLDLSKAAARAIGMLGTGTAKVKVEVLE
jgi:rare lipoprotein A